jgi:hypothetical protein
MNRAVIFETHTDNDIALGSHMQSFPTETAVLFEMIQR